MVDLDAIRARLQAATSGPWRVEPDSRPDIFTVYTVDETGGYFGEGEIVKNTRRCRSSVSEQLHIAEFAKYASAMEDAEFIAHAPEDIAVLLAEVERLQAEFASEREARLITRGERDLLQQGNSTLLAEVERLRAELWIARKGK